MVSRAVLQNKRNISVSVRWRDLLVHLHVVHRVALDKCLANMIDTLEFGGATIKERREFMSSVRPRSKREQVQTVLADACCAMWSVQ